MDIEIEKIKIVSRQSLHAKRRQMREKRARPRNTLTDIQWESLVLWFGNKCLNCRRPFGEYLHPEKDHIIPLSRGGALTIENVQPLCRRCNSIKKARTIDLRDPVRLEAFLKLYQWGKYQP